MTAFEIILIILIILFVGGIISWRICARVHKKNGKSTTSCGCGCSGCAASECCPSARGKERADDGIEIVVQSNVSCDFSDIVAQMTGSSANAEQEQEISA